MNRDSKSKTLMIIGCSKGKLTYKEKVRNFYTGQQFRMLKKLAELNKFDYVVISGLLGLLKPNEYVIPYDHKLKDNKEDIERVRKLTIPKLKEIIPNYNNVICFLPKAYSKVIKPILSEKFLVVFSPKGFFYYNKLIASLNRISMGNLNNIKETNRKVLDSLEEFRDVQY